MTETTRTPSPATQAEGVQARFRIAEGCCLDYAGDLPGALGQLPGVHAVQVLEASGLVVVDHDGTVPAEAVRRRAGQLGLGLLPADRRGRPAAGERPWWRRALLLALAAARAQGHRQVAAALAALGDAPVPTAALGATAWSATERVGRLLRPRRQGGALTLLAGLLLLGLPLAVQALAVLVPLARVAGVPVCPLG